MSAGIIESMQVQQVKVKEELIAAVQAQQSSQ